MLCDHAQVADGKLFINGGGISRFFGPGLPPGTSIALLLLVPWEQTNAPIELDLQLLTADGHAVRDPEGAAVRHRPERKSEGPPASNQGSPSTFRSRSTSAALGCRQVATPGG